MPVGPSYRESWRPSSSTSLGSVAAPVTGAGRVCGTSASSAPSMTTSSTPRSRRQVGDERAERPPAVVRLHSHEKHGVAIGTGNTGAVEGVLGPLDLSRPSVLERDVRTRRLEVHEELRVDVRELLRFPESGEIADGERCRLASVAPPAKRTDQDGPLEGRTIVDPKLLPH